MQKFYDLNERDIIGVIEEKAQGALENAMMGAPSTVDPFADLSNIEQMFRDALDNRAFDGIIPGVPTQASLQGRNLRLKSGKGSVRPSFVLSGLFRHSFKAWISD
jgi:hypothetical protein